VLSNRAWVALNRVAGPSNQAALRAVPRLELKLPCVPARGPTAAPWVPSVLTRCEAREEGEEKQRKEEGDCRGLVPTALVHAVVGGPSTMVLHIRRHRARDTRGRR
jgi:hypothetical protein